MLLNEHDPCERRNLIMFCEIFLLNLLERKRKEVMRNMFGRNINAVAKRNAPLFNGSQGKYRIYPAF